MKEGDTIEVEVPNDDGTKFGVFEPVIIKPKNTQTPVKPAKELPKNVVVKADDDDDDDDDDDIIDLKVIDDVPPDDRNRKPSEPPKDLTDDELDQYTSKKARDRLKHFSKGYHDERRAKEEAQRERAELEKFAKQVLEENKTLKGTVNKNQGVMVEQAKKTVAAELDTAKRQYREAYEKGDTDALVEAQEAIAKATVRLAKVADIRVPPLQVKESEVQGANTQQRPAAEPDPAAAKWRKENPWYDAPGNEDMTAFALGYHHKLLNEGVNPRSSTYYERLNARMREVFPTQFKDEHAEDIETKTKPKKSTNNVAPATRSAAPKKVVLTATAVRLAKRLGVPLDVYAAQVAKEQREQK